MGRGWCQYFPYWLLPGNAEASQPDLSMVSPVQSHALVKAEERRPQGALLLDLGAHLSHPLFLPISPFQLILPLTGHPCLLSSYTHVLASVIVALESPEKPFPLLIEVLPSSPPALLQNTTYLPVRQYQQFLDTTRAMKLSKSPNSLLNRSPVSL